MRRWCLEPGRPAGGCPCKHGACTAVAPHVHTSDSQHTGASGRPAVRSDPQQMSGPGISGLQSTWSGCGQARAHQERSVWGRTGTAREPADTGPHPIMHAQVRDGGEVRSAAGVWLVCVHAGACTSLHVLRGAGAAATAGGSGALPTREMEERRLLLHTHHDYPTPLVESGTSSAVGGADGLPAARKGKEDVMVTNGTRRLC